MNATQLFSSVYDALVIGLSYFSLSYNWFPSICKN